MGRVGVAVAVAARVVGERSRRGRRVRVRVYVGKMVGGMGEEGMTWKCF